jgi:hypothetical protein
MMIRGLLRGEQAKPRTQVSKAWNRHFSWRFPTTFPLLFHIGSTGTVLFLPETCTSYKLSILDALTSIPASWLKSPARVVVLRSLDPETS